MIRFFENYSLKKHNTFAIDAKARYYFEFTEPGDLQVFLASNKSWKNEEIIVLGEGSNILFLNDFDGLVISPKVPGIKEIREDRNHCWIEAGAGEAWDEFVEYCVAHGLGGVENLSMIPGTVGAAPVQNVGAYGREAGDVVELVRGYDLEKQELVELTAGQCRFGYRDSIFKHELKGRIIVTSVIFRLDKFPQFDLRYGQVEQKVQEKGEVSLRNIREAVLEIRSAKLPDVKDLASAGSFFKNPVVDSKLADALKARYEKLPVYPAGAGKTKLAAGWLIEQAGWKGRREGNVGMHEHQALVLVNYGSASGQEVYDFSEKIKNSVLAKLGVSLEREVICV